MTIGRDGTRDRSTADRAFPVLWFGQFSAIAGLTVVVPLLPFYLAGLGVPSGEIPLWTGVTLAAPAVTQLITAPLWGMVGDRYGHKAMVVRAHAGLALAVGLMTLADGPGEFLTYRLLQGACGGVVSATAAYASSVAPEDRRGRTLGGLFGATGAGSLLGPLLGSLLAGRSGFDALFTAVAVLLLVASILGLVLLPRTHARSARRDTPRRPARQVARTLVQQPRTRNLLLAGLLGHAAIYALVVVFAPRVESLTGSVSAATVWVGALQAVTWGASLAGAPWWGRRNDRRRAHVSFAVAAACCAVAVALQGIPTSPETLLALRFAQGFCFAALAQSVLQVACQHTALRVRGTVVGFSSGVLDFGQVCGPLGGALAASLLPLPGAFLAISGLLVLATALAAWPLGGGTAADTTAHPHAALAEVSDR